jgi:hypothetical protein
VNEKIERCKALETELDAADELTATLNAQVHFVRSYPECMNLVFIENLHFIVLQSEEFEDLLAQAEKDRDAYAAENEELKAELAEVFFMPICFCFLFFFVCFFLCLWGEGRTSMP